MDRVESKTRLEEIADLLEEHRQEEAQDMLDGMNWRRVHNISSLLKASEMYEELGRLEDARELLEIAHERSPIGRMILYRLAVVSTKLGELDAAKEYYDDFVQIAPHDSLKYIIKYYINKAKGADDTILIAILEELKSNDFMEEWAFELACLYRKAGQIDKCIALCDEIILWFGDGPYVERALEMKMLYQPLDEMQESKYRSLQNRRDGVTEIRREEFSKSGEVARGAVRIPEVELPPERFNTHNLQAEIRKNIEEIMQASEMGEVSENMDAIKDLVEEIPYLQVKEKPEETPQQEDKKEQDESLRNSFREYLSEEFDGQMSLYMPEENRAEPQVDGQLSIEEVMAQWEKTRRAAEAALSDAKEKELLQYKAKAIAEASQVLDRLMEAMPKLDAGISANQLLKEEYLSRKDPTETAKAPAEEAEPAAEEPEEKDNGFVAGLVAAGAKITAETKGSDARAASPVLRPGDKTFRIPKIGDEEQGGWEIPVISAEKEDDAEAAPLPEAEQDVPEEKDARAAEEELPLPEIVPEAETDDADQALADVSHILQQEIEKLTQETAPEAASEAESAAAPAAPQEEPPEVISGLEESEPAAPDAELPKSEPVSEEPEPVAEPAPEDDDIPEPAEEDYIPEAEPEDAADESRSAEDSAAAAEEKDEIEAAIEAAMETAAEPASRSQEKESAEKAPIPEPTPIYVPEGIQTELTAAEREIFSYFAHVGGMEDALCQLLTGVRDHMLTKGKVHAGHIVIQGRKGSGKTRLATDLIRVLQMETGRPKGNIGKISGQKLNEKDMKQLFDKIRGGCLIIEEAGALEKETIVTLSLMMENDESKILVILEDNRTSMERLLNSDGRLAKKFTERITVPVMTIDELVTFGKVYASENGYVIDDMGVLALYDRINLTQRLDHPTCVEDVRNIIDDAIANHKSGRRGGLLGLFGSRQQEEDDKQVLEERDFQNS